LPTTSIDPTNELQGDSNLFLVRKYLAVDAAPKIFMMMIMPIVTHGGTIISSIFLNISHIFISFISHIIIYINRANIDSSFLRIIDWRGFCYPVKRFLTK